MRDDSGNMISLVQPREFDVGDAPAARVAAHPTRPRSPSGWPRRVHAGRPVTTDDRCP